MEAIKKADLIDKIIMAFIALFLATLTNSIFLNQLGYFAAFFLLIFRIIVQKKDHFYKTGLEIPLVLFLSIELVSAVFSVNQPQAFLYFFKRIFLLPVLFLFANVTINQRLLKKFFLVYIAFALLSVIIYLGYSVKYFVYQIYQTEQSGPSIFQYPITTSEITSFTSLFLFAFLVNEKVEWKRKILYAIAFLISIAALLATYKRTGWMGAAFGIAAILVIKRKWKLILPLAIGAVLFIIIDTNKSEIHFYKYEKGKPVYVKTIKTKGRAYEVIPLHDKILVSDFENGILSLKNSYDEQRINLAQPVASIKKIKDNIFLAYLIDTRFNLVELNPDGNFKIINEFTSPGQTISFALSDSTLYLADKDSGLTVYNNVFNSSEMSRYRELRNVQQVFADSFKLALITFDNEFILFELKMGLPERIIYRSQKPEKIISAVLLPEGFICSDNNSITLFDLKSGKAALKSKYAVDGGISYFFKGNDELFAWSRRGILMKIMYDSNSVVLKPILTENKIPVSSAVHNGQMFFSYVRQSRIRSIWDPYLPSNFNRLAFWKAGWRIFKDHPIIGVGNIDLMEYYKQYKNKFDKEIQGHMHNNFVHILVTLGVAGLIAFCFLLLSIFRIHWITYKKVKEKEFLSSFALGALAGFISFIVSGLTEWNFGDHEIITLVWFVTGMNIAIKRVEESESDKTC